MTDCRECRKYRQDEFCDKCNYEPIESRKRFEEENSTRNGDNNVVRCKDCLHASWCEDVLWCNITDEPMTENDFCSKGDRI